MERGSCIALRSFFLDLKKVIRGSTLYHLFLKKRQSLVFHTAINGKDIIT
ncbi:hypothetical protein KIS1582_0499 [Cytobacillus firmus]|uniref:Uncharacterized protein n=1 Tax=Cytobacillus firmus TaxID=1399 RepID=A0A800NFX1_CYTFI|nr:hypothetical protein KIS1582_0499 [Cytobacillus firmus]